MTRSLLAVALALLSAPALAQYKCLAPDGVTEYRSTPCPANAKPLNAPRAPLPGPSDQPSGPNYWQREAARLERKEAAERQDQQAFEARQAQQERAKAPAERAVTDERSRRIVCDGVSVNVGSGVSTNHSSCREKVIPTPAEKEERRRFAR